MTSYATPCAWTEVMLERLLRIDGRRLGELDPDQRLDARRALDVAFPNTQEARLALAAFAATGYRRRRMADRRRRWTPKEDRIVREHYADTDTKELAARLGRTVTAVFGRANGMGLRKSPELISENARRYLPEAGKAHRFPKGHKLSPNRGVKGWDAGGRSHQTRFKKGQLSNTWVPVGTEVRDPDGYLKRKVSDDRSVDSRFNWRFVHHLVWEEANGPIPPGHVVAFIDGDRANVSIENLELSTRGELAKRNHHSNLPPELVEVIFMAGWVKRKLREREEAEQDGRTAESGR